MNDIISKIQKSITIKKDGIYELQLEITDIRQCAKEMYEVDLKIQKYLLSLQNPDFVGVWIDGTKEYSPESIMTVHCNKIQDNIYKRVKHFGIRYFYYSLNYD